jgi:AraC-like DNA-binding protein
MKRKLASLSEAELLALAAEKNFRVGPLARACGVGRRTFHRFCKLKFHASPRKLLSLARMDVVKNGKAHQEQLKSLVSAAGYAHLSSLARRYKQMFGCAPGSKKDPPPATE